MCSVNNIILIFPQGSTGLNKLHKVLMTKKALSDVEKLSPHYQTSIVESFHSAILPFARKRVVFLFTGMLYRYVFSLTT